MRSVTLLCAEKRMKGKKTNTRIIAERKVMPGQPWEGYKLSPKLEDDEKTLPTIVTSAGGAGKPAEFDVSFFSPFLFPSFVFSPTFFNSSLHTQKWKIMITQPKKCSKSF
ncbi:unnamed protein product [Gongylonema pulchrum]|uniref:Uncharacterized protein n=1 Tax=Gongylonema pulchrum TaxID=637853 RepID=A0A183D8R4_9BILA|nr:unnamed protein product [Gongylonema pulchrum]